MVDTLANKDITKHDEVYKMNFLYCLDVLSMYKDRDRYMEQQHKIAMRKNKR